MRLGEALRINGDSPSGPPKHLHLLLGFMPLHLETFLKARAKLRFPGQEVKIHTGLFGDLEGNLERARETAAEGAVVIIEWSDLDSRLGFRTSAGWSLETLEDIPKQAEEKMARLANSLKALAEKMPVVVIAPTLALPPLTYWPPTLSSTFELHLDFILADVLSRISQCSGIRVASSTQLSLESPPAARHDLKLELLAGFPYSIPHTDVVAALAIQALFQATQKKGLITDLDQTLWKGILGDLGAEGVTWSLDGKSHSYSLYQQALASLAETGTLVAIASKNDPDAVAAALRRSDLLIAPTHLFPVEASWGPKSEAVGRILKAWNIGADSVVFVDDSPMELAEVAEKFPGIECILFPSDDPANILALIHQLRVRFGKTDVREEDRLRLASLRTSAELDRDKQTQLPSDFLARLNATVTFDPAEGDPRAFELVNKTNQFHLNGTRYTEAEWRDLASRPGAFLSIISYTDRFGPLGRIAVIGGQLLGEVCQVDIWVMSCRAFSRQIEFQTIRHLLDVLPIATLQFAYRSNNRNGPVRTFLGGFFSPEQLDRTPLELTAVEFHRNCPPLFHQVAQPAA